MAVDAPERRMLRSDAGRQKGQVLFLVALAQKPVHKRFLKVKNLIVFGDADDGDFPFETVNDNHDRLTGGSRDCQRVKPGIFQISAEMASKIGDTGNAGQRRQGNRHALARSGKLRNAAQRPRCSCSR
ncbi:MAG: hypothetical protein BWY42_01786 [Candidatus Omnitrophica bacterium ADurb.Bin277]|nr:MAG: hypothetical protein BWY42_01786 [Candidatus Omnitrophica bacterium ADurb.Bin277]